MPSFLFPSFRRAQAALRRLMAPPHENQSEVMNERHRLWGLTIEQMQQLGLYISYPRSDKETDHPFAEPGLFVVNAEGNVQVVDVSNNPFVRPDIEQMYSGLKWIRENDYPIRGTYP